MRIDLTRKVKAIEEKFGVEIILLTLAGSRAHGLEREDSDWDYIGVFVAPIEKVLSIGGLKRDTYEIQEDDIDITVHEIRKFFSLALKGNPTVLQVLWNPVVYSTPIGDRMIEIRKAFLHKSSLKPYLGYAESQLRKLKNKQSVHSKGGEYGIKFAVHLLRLLHSAIYLAKNGEVLVDLIKVPKVYEELWDVMVGEKTKEWVIERARELVVSVEKWMQATTLPDKPDYDKANEFLYDVRLGQLEGDK